MEMPKKTKWIAIDISKRIKRIYMVPVPSSDAGREEEGKTCPISMNLRKTTVRGSRNGTTKTLGLLFFLVGRLSVFAFYIAQHFFYAHNTEKHSDVPRHRSITGISPSTVRFEEPLKHARPIQRSIGLPSHTVSPRENNP